MNPTIRPFQPSDLEALKRITAEAFRGASIDEVVEQRFGILHGHDWRWRKLIEEKCGANLSLCTHMERDPAGFDRVRFAVLKLSNGDLIRLMREIESARLDWRDTLMAAGFGEDVHAHLQWHPKPTR